MKKIYKELTIDQIKRGIVFSSQLMPGIRIHEVHEEDEDKEKKIEKLLNDSFFDQSHFKYNEIRQ